jgi:hypothetical protein
MRNISRKLATAAAGVIMTATTAAAQNSVINFAGSANVRDETPGGGGSFLLIDFLTGTVAGYPTPGTATTTPVTDLAGVAVPSQVTVYDLRASSTTFTGLPQLLLQTAGGWSFTLTGTDAGNAFGPVSLFQAGPNVLGAFNVVGTVTNNLLNYNGTFSGAFTTQFLNTTSAAVFAAIDAGGTQNASYSASLNLTPSSTVPEPSTYVLLATGIGALGMVARRRRTTV